MGAGQTGYCRTPYYNDCWKVKAAEKIIGDNNQRVIVAATPEGRFFAVAIGQSALDTGLHYHMCVTM